jgi:hypothetical protein
MDPQGRSKFGVGPRGALRFYSCDGSDSGHTEWDAGESVRGVSDVSEREGTERERVRGALTEGGGIKSASLSCVCCVCVNEAKRRGVTMREACEGILASWLEEEAVRRIEKRMRDEATDYMTLRARNEMTRRMVAQWEEADRLALALGKHAAAYEAGRRAVEVERSMRERERRRKRKEALERSNGSSDLQ